MASPSIDRRAARTRAKLQQAHLKLILSKGYEATTIKDICDAADVGRSTFYAHYADKDDLKRGAFEQQLRRLLADQPPALGFSLAKFEHAREYLHIYRALAGNRGGAVALDAVRRILSDQMRRELAVGGEATAGAPAPREVVVQYLVGAYLSLLTWWLDGGAKISPQR